MQCRLFTQPLFSYGIYDVFPKILILRELKPLLTLNSPASAPQVFKYKSSLESLNMSSNIPLVESRNAGLMSLSDEIKKEHE